MTRSNRSDWPTRISSYSRYISAPADRDLARTLDELTFLDAAQPARGPIATQAPKASWLSSLTSVLHLRAARAASTLPAAGKTV